ncbi:hypothetical protein HDZ31DRAFT_61739 [Schizophyllum fasciatum]
MLRWGQSTVQRLGGGGHSSRFYTTRSTLLHRTRPPATKTKTKLTPPRPTPPAVIIPENAGTTSPLSQGASALDCPSEGVVKRQRSPRAQQDAIAPTRAGTNLIPPGKLALYRLRHWLADPHHPAEYTPEDLYDLYSAVKHRGHLAHLSPSHFSLLLHLFGMQADAGAALNPTRRTHSLSDYKSKAPNEYWHVVRTFVEDMEGLGKPLNTHDLHWAMLAHLSLVASVPTVHAKRNALKGASLYYHRLLPTTADPKAHLPFLHTLQEFKQPTTHRQLITYACILLEAFHTLDPALFKFIWRTILCEQTHASTEAQSRIMQAIRTRFYKFRPPAPPANSVKEFGLRAKGLQVMRLAILHVLHISEPMVLPSEVIRWAHEVVNHVLKGGARWHSLCILLYSTTFDVHRGTAPLPSHTHTDDKLVLQWRTICVLDVLDRQIALGPPADVNVSRSLVHSLWTSWEAAVLYPKANHHLIATRAVVSTFLRLSAWTADAALSARCLAFARSRVLFYVPDIASEQTLASVRELVVAILVSRVADPQVAAWDDVFQPLVDVPRAVVADAAGMVVKKLVRRDFSAARALVSYCARSGIPMPPSALCAVGEALAATFPYAAIANLSALRRSPYHAQLLLAILRSLRQGRWETVSNAEAWDLYAACRQLTFPLSEALRYDVRGCVAILISSGRAAEGMQLARLLARSAPTWITLPFCRLLIRLLVRKREFRLAAGVLELFRHGAPLAQRALKREVVARLEGASASRLAGHVRGRTRSATNGSVESLPLSVSAAEALSEGQRRQLVPARTITSLLRAGRPSAAWRAFRRASCHLAPTTRTALGNALISRAFARRRTARILIRDVLRARMMLARQGDFVPDAATANVLLKAVLRWRALFGERLRAMFDHVACAMLGWQRPVFGTVAGKSGSTVEESVDDVRDGRGTEAEDTNNAMWAVLEPLPRATSFSRHIRPMLRMFVKAFHLRGDREAARVVWKLLKAGEEKYRAQRRAMKVAKAAGVRRKARGRVSG